MNHYDIFDKIIDSNDFTAGGGSAAALAGAMAAGMAAMVARLSLKKQWGLTNDEYEKIADEADKIAEDLLSGSIEDNQAYLLIKNAYSLPKDTAAEKAERSEAIQKAAVKAALVPLANGKKCIRVYELCRLLKDNSNTNAGSDLMAAAQLSYSGVMGCAFNIDANLPLIKNENIRSDFAKEALELKQIAKP